MRGLPSQEKTHAPQFKPEGFPKWPTNALWQDLTGDGQAELVVAGEWMPIRVFKRSDVGLFDDISDELARISHDEISIGRVGLL